MKEPVLKLDSDLSKTVGFTREYFSAGTIYNLLPRGIYINWLTPTREDSIDYMFSIIDRNNILFRYSAPKPEICRKLEARGYYLARDVAGTPYYCNFKPKKNVKYLVLPKEGLKIIDNGEPR